MGSATNRGSQRQPNDRYDTPPWATRLVLPWLAPFQTAIDPCCGGGAILEVVLTECRGVTSVAAIDIDRRAVVECRRRIVPLARRAGAVRPVFQTRDARQPWWPPADLCITNPPYCIAQAVLERALRECAHVAALLRVGFLESRERRDFWRRHGDADIHVFERRPSFIGGGSDASAYAWFTWPGEARWRRLESPACGAARRPRHAAKLVFEGAHLLGKP